MPVTDGLSIDQIIDQALAIYRDLPDSGGYRQCKQQINELRERLAGGKLRLAVLGQFNRGKSTFINALLHLHVLPASVLPITSVPTVITYGAKHRCTVSFLNDTTPKSAENSLEEISKLLVKYVAEENNPQNRLNVAGVTVECSSSILHHGTVLIDTPGFGSTHIHNTQTTLDLLTSCDAALFLLSADLPITQIEVDFLKNVQKHVPRIFFIFNKTDLLEKEELEKTQNYIRGILIRELSLTGDIRLFPVTAIQAGRGEYGDGAWKSSGMEKVKTEIIDFMLREKYFTLAEALNTKFRNALSQTRSIVDTEKQEHIKSIHDAETLIKDTRHFITETQKEIDKERNLLSVERKAFHERIRKAFESRMESTRQKNQQYADQLLSDTTLSRSQLALIWSSLEKITHIMLGNTLGEIKETVIRPLRNAETAHRRQINQLVTKGKELRRLPAEYDTISEPTPEEIESLRGDCLWTPEPFQALPEIKFSIFESSEKKRDQATNHIRNHLNQYWEAGAQQMLMVIDTLVDQSMDRLSQRFNSHYEKIETIIKKQLDEAEGALKLREKQHTPQIEKLEEFRGRINQVEKLLA